MPDIYPPSKQRAALIEFAAALDSAPAALRRDECSDWRIGGDTGKVFAMATIGKASVSGFGIYIERSTARAWTAVKSKLQFCQIPPLALVKTVSVETVSALVGSDIGGGAGAMMIG
jgi:hypothetical protein